MFLLKYILKNSLLAFFCFGMLISTHAIAKQKSFDKIVVFGASLSDPGNGFVVLSDPESFGYENCESLTPLNVPPYDTLNEFFVPDGVYAIGGHHVSNGATWIEQFARGKGLAGFTRPALRNKGKQALNYAVGGARAGEMDCRFNLSDQLMAFSESSTKLTKDSLIVFEMGGNDVRDALLAFNPNNLGPAFQKIEIAIQNIAIAIAQLYNNGARQFLLMNVPNIGQTPAVIILDNNTPGLINAANFLTSIFNQYLTQLHNLYNADKNYDGIKVSIFNVNKLLVEIVANPAEYGIEVVDQPCVMPNEAPFKCRNPDEYLFWDGIHPTKAVHKIMADEAAETLSKP